MKATVKDLWFQSCELLNTVSRGEGIIITYIGRPCAKLVPYQNEGKKDKEDKLFGIWKGHKAIHTIDEYVRKLKKGRL